MSAISPIKPIQASYWVLPGRLLAGEYPGDLLDFTTKIKLKKFLEAGVTYFLDLTEEGENNPYEEILAKLARKQGRTIHYQRMAIPDMDIPDERELMVQILDTIDQALAGGHCLYFHCWAGIGRTGTVAGCYLARHGEPGEAALDHLQELWKDNVKSAYYGTPQTEAQGTYVLNWREEGTAN